MGSRAPLPRPPSLAGKSASAPPRVRALPPAPSADFWRPVVEAWGLLFAHPRSAAEAQVQAAVRTNAARFLAGPANRTELSAGSCSYRHHFGGHGGRPLPGRGPPGAGDGTVNRVTDWFATLLSPTTYLKQPEEGFEPKPPEGVKPLKYSDDSLEGPDHVEKGYLWPEGEGMGHTEHCAKVNTIFWLLRPIVDGFAAFYNSFRLSYVMSPFVGVMIYCAMKGPDLFMICLERVFGGKAITSAVYNGATRDTSLPDVWEAVAPRGAPNALPWAGGI